MTSLFNIQTPDLFRENIRKKLKTILVEDNLAINLEKGIYNYWQYKLNNL